MRGHDRVRSRERVPHVRRKVTALLHSMSKNHALVDGNKRLAWLSTVALCDVNSVALHLTDDEAFQLVWILRAATSSSPRSRRDSSPIVERSVSTSTFTLCPFPRFGHALALTPIVNSRLNVVD